MAGRKCISVSGLTRSINPSWLTSPSTMTARARRDVIQLFVVEQFLNPGVNFFKVVDDLSHRRALYLHPVGCAGDALHRRRNPNVWHFQSPGC